MSEQIKQQILILDDDRQLAEMMADFLRLSSDCEVDLTHEEKHFWEKLPGKSYDIIFLDYRLPGITGLEILEKLAEKNNQVPVVMMTGEGNEQIAVKAIQSGAFDYLVKGEYALSVLPSLVEKAVRMRKLQNEMRRSLNQIRYQATLLDNMRDAVVVWDMQGRINYWNFTAELLYGFSQKDRLGTRVEDTYLNTFDPPIELPSPRNTNTTEMERRYIGKDGQPIWISSRITPLYDINEGSETIGFMDVARDITNRKLEQQRHLETSHFLERVVSSSPDLVFIYNLHTYTMRFANPKFEHLLGYAPEEIYSKGEQVLNELVHPDDLPFLKNHFKKLQNMKDHSVEGLDFRLRDSDGRWHWFSGHESVFSRDEDGTPLEIIGIAQDITEKKKTETRLQQRLVVEKLLSSISNFFINLSADNTDNGVDKAFLLIGNYIRPDYGAIYLYNEPVGSLDYYCGFEKSASNSKVLQDKGATIFAKEIPWLISQLNQQVNFQIAHLDELPNEAFKEKLFFNERNIRALIAIPMIYNNELIGVLTMFMTHQEHKWSENHTHMLQTFAEMTVNALVQKWSEEKLLTSEARYRAIVDEHQTELICRMNAEFDLTFVNETFSQYFKQNREALLGQNVIEMVYSEDREAVVDALKTCSPAEPITRFQCRTLLGKRIHWLECTARAIYSEQGELFEYQGVGHDISDRKHMEHQLQTAQSHIAQNIRMAAVGELAASVAHQISNPLTTIIAEAQLLTHELNKQHSGHESAQAIIKAGWRAQHVIQELLKFSESPKNTKEDLDLNETIQKAVFLAGAHIQASGTTQLVVNLAEDLPKIRGNLQQLEDLWVNLLLLARDATEDEKPHTIKVISRMDPEAQGICVAISDDGKPLTEEELETIFEPKMIPTGLGRGTGIELSLCREIVRQHQGKISAKIIQGNTVFEICFPGESETYGTN